jgi:hypothetical protein
MNFIHLADFFTVADIHHRFPSEIPGQVGSHPGYPRVRKSILPSSGTDGHFLENCAPCLEFSLPLNKWNYLFEYYTLPKLFG